ncbi:MAG: alpha/beta hydrolase [Halothiobacillaceae bacterium]
MTRYLALPLLLIALPCSGQVNDAAEDELDRIERELEQARQVNEGAFRLVPPPDRPVHEHHNVVHLAPSSLATGIAVMEQCHINLDPVPSTQIVYNPDTLRRVRIVARSGIGRAWVEGHRVELRDVKRGARICLVAESRIVKPGPEGSHVLRGGPFMRRFLDGYYPMRVTIRVDMPGHRLELLGTEPGPETGFRVKERDGALTWDGWFEGELRTAIRFRVR